jgi:hypothetical protein
MTMGMLRVRVFNRTCKARSPSAPST